MGPFNVVDRVSLSREVSGGEWKVPFEVGRGQRASFFVQCRLIGPSDLRLRLDIFGFETLTASHLL